MKRLKEDGTKVQRPHDIPKGSWTHDAGGDATTRPNYIPGYKPSGRGLKTREGGGKRGK